ncbi:MAG: hypothetical protein CYPHOPRED_000109 [Cyphobasidiales sp. Tagirdzhanova-0007]|nr:MAG: hypothetical protein CYPHOPRED_000109 [Cyphobasidiales sp. Tagirdzhanova-0007]
MLYRVPNVNFSALDIWIHWALSQLCSVVASFLTFPAYDLTREIEYILVSKKQFEDAEPRGIETQVLAVDGSPQASLTPSMIFVEADSSRVDEIAVPAVALRPKMTFDDAKAFNVFLRILRCALVALPFIMAPDSTGQAFDFAHCAIAGFYFQLAAQKYCVDACFDSGPRTMGIVWFRRMRQPPDRWNGEDRYKLASKQEGGIGTWSFAL